jgi:hypothetical protein
MTRKQILEEIRRTAAANAGKPLGAQRLFGETGIKRAHWRRYWARLGDAHREAGCEPNKMTASRTDEDLLSNLAELVRELGHFPVEGEIRLKAINHAGFPSHNTFGKFGGRVECDSPQRCPVKR